MEQSGSAGRDAYIAGGDIHNYFQSGHPPSTTSNEVVHAAETTSEPSEGSGRGGLGWVVLCLIAVIVFAGHSALSSDSANSAQFPSKTSPWPAHSTARLVLSLVTTRLASCAEEPVLSPVNCPQSASSGGDQVTGVHWAIHGNPSDGAQIRYSDGKFWVLGHAVMTVTYEDSMTGDRWQMNIIGFEATVAWDSGHPTLASLQAANPDTGPRIIKNDPDLPWAKVTAAVIAGFRHCANEDVTPLPAQCMGIGAYGNRPVWKLEVNPILNAAETFDPATGLVHVDGSYAMTESYRLPFWNSHETTSLSGNYDAVLSLDGTKVTLLQIVQANS